jgi:hypothetical protein
MEDPWRHLLQAVCLFHNKIRALRKWERSFEIGMLFAMSILPEVSIQKGAFARGNLPDAIRARTAGGWETVT